MASRRKEIRAAVIDLLKTNVSSFDSRVFNSRNSAIWEDAELPCACVYTSEEPVENFNDFPKITNRRLTLNIDFFVEDKIGADLTSTADDLLDDLAEEIEGVMDANQSLNSLAVRNDLTNTKMTLIDSSKQVGVARMSYVVKYQKRNPGGY